MAGAMDFHRMTPRSMISATARPATYTESAYHGEHEFSDEPWIAEDGLRLFTREREVFTLSTNQSEDMIYNRTLEIENNLWIDAMDHITSRNRLCAVYFVYNGEPGQSKVKIFSGDS